jgi:DNA-binding NarL/FixJ family response regulator
MSTRVLLMEDDALTRSAIASALEAKGYEISAQASNVAQAIEAISTNEIDVVVLDLDVGVGPTGMDLADVLARRLPNLAIVLLTSSVDPRLIRASLPEIPSNAIYVVKQDVADMSVLTNAIEDAIKTSQDTSRKLNQYIDQIPLTDVQMETLRLVAQGLTNAEIAKQRFVTEKAVEYTISKIATALNIETTTSSNQRVHIARMYFRLRGQG